MPGFSKRKFGGKRRRRRKMALSRKVNLIMARSQPETKFVAAGSTGAITTAVVMDMLPNWVQGTGDTNRVGAKIFMKYLIFKAALTWNSSSTIQFSAIRLTLVEYRDATLPAYTDVFASSLDLLALWSTNNAGRYRVLHDRVYRVGDRGNAGRVNYINIKLKLNKHLIFAEDADTAPNNVRYAILLIGDDTNGPNLKFSNRIAFTG